MTDDRDERESQQDPVIAPQHEVDLEVTGLEPRIIEGVAYSPLKMTFLCNHDDDVRVFCKSCDWGTTVGELPEDGGRVQPDMCPACAKNGEIGFVRHERGGNPLDINDHSGRAPDNWKDDLPEGTVDFIDELENEAWDDE